MWNHQNNVPFQLSPPGPWANSCPWAHDVRLHIVGTNEPKSPQKSRQTKKYNWSEVIHDTHSANIPRSKMSLIYEIMKTMWPAFEEFFSLVYWHIVFIFHWMLKKTNTCWNLDTEMDIFLNSVSEKIRLLINFVITLVMLGSYLRVPLITLFFLYY